MHVIRVVSSEGWTKLFDKVYNGDTELSRHIMQEIDTWIEVNKNIHMNLFIAKYCICTKILFESKFYRQSASPITIDCANLYSWHEYELHDSNSPASGDNYLNHEHLSKSGEEHQIPPMLEQNRELDDQLAYHDVKEGVLYLSSESKTYNYVSSDDIKNSCSQREWDYLANKTNISKYREEDKHLCSSRDGIKKPRLKFTPYSPFWTSGDWWGVADDVATLTTTKQNYD